jgi:ADP-heptose:LPS heptosyltransferase
MSAVAAPRPHVLACRLDNAGDVLLTGPAVRAIAADAARLSFLCGPRGAAAARLLPGVSVVLVHRAPWIDPDAREVVAEEGLALVRELAALAIDEAILFTSHHQSALPMALLLRLAGVTRIAAISDDFPGALLDVRHRVGEMHEVERNLSLAAALGHRLPAGDDGRLAIALSESQAPSLAGAPGFVAVHPGASCSARAWAPARYAELIEELAASGFRVVVTGGPEERELGALIAGPRRLGVLDLSGKTDLPALAQVLKDACALVSNNTGPAHLAAAVGTPVVALYAPTVPPSRWRPWGVRHALLGQLDAPCAGCRARRCPLPTHACLEQVTPAEVTGALRRVLADPDVTFPATVSVRS